MKKIVKRIEDLANLHEDKKEEKALRQLLIKYPSDIYCLSQLAGALLYQEKFDEALSVIQKADTINPKFPLVPYYKGKILLCVYKAQLSVKCWDFIIETPVDDLINEEYGINIKRIKSLKNDAFFYKATSLYCLGFVKEAKKFAYNHLNGRVKGLKSDFTKKEVKDYIRELKYSRITPADIVDGFDGDTTEAQFKRICDHIDKLKKQGDIARLIKYFKRKTHEFPKCYFLWTIMSEYCYDYGIKDLCLKSAEKAHILENTENDMLVLFDYGSALFLNERYDEAIAVFDKIINEDINYIAYGEHGEGMRSAKELVATTKEMKEDCIKHKAKAK